MVLLPLNSLNSDINNLVYNYKATSIQLLVALFFFHLPTFIFSQDTCEYYYQKKEIADSLKNAEKYSQAFETLTGLEKQLAEDNCWKNWYSCLSAQRTLASYHNYSRMDTVLDRNLNLAQLALPKQKANFYYLASYTYNQRGKVYKSIDYAETALQLYDSLNIQKSKLSMLRNLAINHSHFNDQQSAINYGLALINELPKDDFRNLSRDYNLLATYYLHSAKYQESLLYADSSIYYLNTIPVPENESDKRRFSKIIDNRFLSIKLNQAQAYNYLNNVDLSFKILDNLEAKYGTTQEFLLEKANILEQSGKYQEALRIKEKKFKDYKSLLNNRDFAKEIHSFANTLFLNGELDRALKISQDVIQFFCIDFKDSNFLSNPNKNQIVPEAFLMESLLLKAKILIHKKENEGNQNISPELIFQTFDLSIESLNILRGLFQELDSKLNYSENELNIFADAIAYAMSLYNKDKSKEYFEKAFQYSQLAKSFTLKQSISSSHCQKSTLISFIPLTTLQIIISL